MNIRALRPIVAILVLSAFAGIPAANAQLFSISQKDELAAGRQADEQIRQKYRISNDPNWNGMVRFLGNRLVRVCERPDLQWTFRVIDSKEINAFSVPGYVYVNTGLLQFVNGDQEELAGVIAHEIGHTCGRHAVKQTQQSQVSGLIAGLIGLGTRNQTIGALANVAANMVDLGHSRGDEYDADHRGERYMIKAGYDPYSMLRFFNALEQKEGNGPGGVVAYFQTHPRTGDRIQRLEKEIAQDENGHHYPEDAQNPFIQRMKDEG